MIGIPLARVEAWVGSGIETVKLTQGKTSLKHGVVDEMLAFPPSTSLIEWKAPTAQGKAGQSEMPSVFGRITAAHRCPIQKCK